MNKDYEILANNTSYRLLFIHRLFLINIYELMLNYKNEHLIQENNLNKVW